MAEAGEPAAKRARVVPAVAELVERVRAGGDYAELQELLDRVAPDDRMTFLRLRTTPAVA